VTHVDDLDPPLLRPDEDRRDVTTAEREDIVDPVAREHFTDDVSAVLLRSH
jgi:hypothetical protein